MGFVFVILKLFFIQVVQNKDYLAKAKDQHSSVRVLQAKRGEILSSDGFPLATNKITYLLFAEPKEIEDKEAYAKALAPILVDKPSENGLKGLFPSDGSSLTSDKLVETLVLKEITETEKRIIEYLSMDKAWVMIKKGLSREEKKKVEELKLKWLGFEEEPLRYYPEGFLSSHILGYVAGGDAWENQGYFGLEGYFNGDLKGKPGKIYEELGATGNIILLGGFRKIPSQDGRSLVTTVRRDVQFVVEKLLREGVEKYRAESGSVLIMNPISGDVIALANYPTFDPSDIADKALEASPELKILKRNIVISDTYEPGSIIKPVTVAAAIDLKLVDEYTTFNDDGPKTYSGHTIDNWNGKHLGIQNIRELLEKSNNIGASWVGMKVGAKDLYRYFRKFGFGEYTGIALEGENAGVLRDSNEWRDIDLATAAFGQGLSLSVVQVASAFSVFDNGGRLVKPRVVSAILDGKRRIDVPVEYKRKIISEETLGKMRKLLVNAVDAGESRYFNVKNYTIAGKTGTAQIPIEGKYDPNKTNVTFVGFLPNVENSKKFVMVVKLQTPTSSIYAAETAVPLWMQLLKELVKIYKIPPDR